MKTKVMKQSSIICRLLCFTFQYFVSSNAEFYLFIYFKKKLLSDCLKDLKEY